MDRCMEAAIEEAQRRLAEGGFPIGSVRAIDDRIVARGHKVR